MITGSKDTDINVLLYLEDKDLLNIYLVNKYLRDICESEEFWQLRTQGRFPTEEAKPKELTWKQWYIELVPVSLSQRTRFRYGNCITPKILNNPEKYLHSVTFNISRGAKHEHTLYFYKKHTIAEAIKKVEVYLSKPMTQDYFDKIKDDQSTRMHRNPTLKDYKVRGYALGNAILPNPGGHIDLTGHKKYYSDNPNHIKLKTN